MAISLEDFSERKRKVEKAQREEDRSVGALQQLMTTLKEDWGKDSLKSAERLAEDVREEERQEFKNLNRAVVVFDEEWETYIKEVGDE